MSAEPESAERSVDESARDTLVRQRVEWRRQYELTEQPSFDPKWLPQVREPTPEELARSAEVEAADVAAGLDGSDEIYTDESGMPLPEYEGLLPEWMIDNIRRRDPTYAESGTRSDATRPEGVPAPVEAVESSGEESGPRFESPGALNAGEPGFEDVRYSSPAAVYDGVMSGVLTATEARRHIRALEADGTPEPTTELVREEGDLDFELGTPTEAPEDAELSDDDAGKSLRERLISKVSEPRVVEDLRDTGKEFLLATDRLFFDRPQPTGAYVGTQDNPVIRQAPKESLDGGAIAVLPVLAAIGVDRVVRWARRERIPSRGDRDDAGQ